MHVMDLKLNLNLKQETRNEVVGRLKARAKDGSERWIEEVIPSTRTRNADGTWSEWTELPRQFLCDGQFCVRNSETEFAPLISDEILVVEGDAKA